ncbi:MAG: hypothetical protein FJ215_03795 [Ignavibacteria bacterium]|nr:hypothetical protein [Ignavibacteria bacterium]
MRHIPIFYARVEGEQWVAGGVTEEPAATARYGGLNLQIIGKRRKAEANSLEQILLEMVNISKPGTYRLGILPRADGVGFFLRNDTAIFRTQETTVGTVTIDLFDHTNRRVAGTFEFDAEGQRSASIAIREGRYDVRW